MKVNSAEQWFGAYFLRIIDIAWSAYTSVGRRPCPQTARLGTSDGGQSGPRSARTANSRLLLGELAPPNTAA